MVVFIDIYKFPFQVEELVSFNVLIIDMPLYGILWFNFYCKGLFKQMVFSFASYYCEFCEIILFFPSKLTYCIYIPFNQSTKCEENS